MILVFFLFWGPYRRHVLERKLADADVSEEEQNNILKYLERKETEYMRLQRHKMGSDDFEPLTMIGKGAFGEVSVFLSLLQFMCLYCVAQRTLSLLWGSIRLFWFSKIVCNHIFLS